MTWISIAYVKTFTLQVFREYPLSPQGWTCPQEYWTVSVCQQFLLHFSEMGKSFSLKPCWKKTCEFCQVGLLACPLVCVVVLQIANYEKRHRLAPFEFSLPYTCLPQNQRPTQGILLWEGVLRGRWPGFQVLCQTALKRTKDLAV